MSTKKLSTWWIGELREDLLGFRKGELVLTIRSTKHLHCEELNPCYWIMQPKKGRIAQVSSYLYGENAHKLVVLKTEAPMSAQDQATENAKKLLANSVYSPKGQKVMAKFMEAVYQFRERKTNVSI